MTFENLSVVIPYRKSTPDRERLFDWTWARYWSLFPDAELVQGMMTSDCEFFCRAEAINNGVRQAERPWLLIADADVVVFPVAVQQAIERLETESRLARVFPYGNYHHLSAASTGVVLLHSPGDDPRAHARLQITASYPNSTSGLVVLSRDAFWASGGFDERMKGWGPEDQAWDLAFETLCGPSSRINEWDLYHLYHDVTPGHRQDNPHYAESAALWDRYKAASGNNARMRALVEEAS